MIESLRALYKPSAQSYSEHLKALWRDERPDDGRLERLAIRIFRSKMSEFDLALVRTADPVKALGQRMAANLALDSGSKTISKIVLKAFAGKWKASKARPDTSRVVEAVEAGGAVEIGVGLVQAASIRAWTVSGLCVVAIAKARGRSRLGLAMQAMVAEAMGHGLDGTGYEHDPILRVLAFDAAVEWQEDEETREKFKESVKRMFYHNIHNIIGALDSNTAADLLDDVQEITLLWTMEVLVEFCQQNGLRFSTGMNNCSHTTALKLRARDRLWRYMVEAEDVSQVLAT